MAGNPQRIVELLEGREGWVDARYLAEALDVSSRTIRTYVRRVNDQHEEPLIESSYHGYRLSASGFAARAASEAPAHGPDLRPQEERAWAMIRRLISTNLPVSIYDLAEEFYVSDSTVEADLKRIRELIRYSDLSVSRYRDRVRLEGSELSKRKLIGQILATENPMGLSVFTGHGIVLEGYDAASLAHTVSGCLAEQGLGTDDFGLNNIVMHLVVMVDRMRQGMQMPDDVSFSKVEGSPSNQAALGICEGVASEFGLETPRSEIGYLTLVIASNSRARDYSFATHEDLSGVIEPSDIELARRAVSALEHAYYLEPFDNDFVMRLAVHVHSLLQRAENDISARNPLLSKIKETYPLVYDMAVFVAHFISQAGGVALSEDEIAFLAFHIGAYLEKSGPGSELVTATFLYMDYHDMHRLALDRIREEFKNTLTVIRVVPVMDFDPQGVESDLVLSPIALDVPGPTQVVVLSPILTEADLRAARRAVEAQMARRRGAQARSLINRFLSPELFVHNCPAASPEELIHTLVADCQAKGYVNEGYCEEVLAREAMSPTSFGNRVALPHSMSASANRSFLSIVVNDQSMEWGQHSVNLVVLLGISPDDRQTFRLLFDSLLEVLSDPANVSRLVRCETFPAFADTLNALISAGA